MRTPTSIIEVSSSNEDGVFSIELLGQKLTRPEATSLARKLVALLGLDAEPGTEAPAGAPPKFTPGVARSRLDHFLRATSGRSPESEPRRTPGPPPVAPIRMGDALAPTVAEPPAPEIAPPEKRAPARARDAGSFIHERAEEWWRRSSQPGLEAVVRAEARAIAAELFEIAVELER